MSLWGVCPLPLRVRFAHLLHARGQLDGSRVVNQSQFVHGGIWVHRIYHMGFRRQRCLVPGWGWGGGPSRLAVHLPLSTSRGFKPQGWSGSPECTERPETGHFVFWEARLTGLVGVRGLTQTGQETFDSR